MAGHPIFAAVYDRMTAHAERSGLGEMRGTVLAHVLDHAGGRLGSWQDRLRRPWGLVSGGCNPNRDTLATLAAAGYDISGLERTELPAAPPIVESAIRGHARPPSG